MIPLARDAENVQFAIKTDVGIAASGLERERENAHRDEERRRRS